jgi:DNA-binding NtrC family response regulator
LIIVSATECNHCAFARDGFSQRRKGLSAWNLSQAEVSMGKSSASGGGMAQGFLEVQSVNGFNQDVESQSARRLNGTGPDQALAPARLIRPGAFSRIVRASRVMDDLLAKIEHMRDISAPMLITGETGAGKELIARTVHDLSPRYIGEFIPFDCGGVTPELIVNELFGHRRGAFTGADRDYAGIIRTANGGTLFLDEIGELPLAEQPKLLRFLQEGEVRPVGETRSLKVNVRVIAATNRDLEADVRAGRFRDDLYHRLNVFHLHITPLRERRGDIRPLIEHFLDLRQREIGKHGLQLSDDAWALMLGHDWPGNVRQLAAVAHRLVAFAENDELIGLESALNAIRTGICVPPPAVVVGGVDMIDFDLPLHEAEDKLKRLMIEHALKVTGGNRLRSAERLGVDRSGLRKMINRLGIEVNKNGARNSRK